MSTQAPREELQDSAARIRDAMAAKELRPVDVAQAIDMPDRFGSSVHNWMKGRNAPTPRYRQKLADLLGLDVADLVPPDWDASPGMRAANAMSANMEARRGRDREYKRRARERKAAQVGPAEMALRAFKPDMPDRQPPSASDVLSTTLRSDGTMRLKLDLTVPAEQGMRLVALLHDAIAKGSSRDGQPG